MTRKDYVMIAEVFHNARQEQLAWIDEAGEMDEEALEAEDTIKLTREHVAADLADRFAKDNPRFDRDRFMKACGVEA